MPGSLPLIVQPLLEKVRARIPARNVPLDFWQIDSGPLILDGFMDLASLLMLSDLREEDVPRGYLMLSYLFDWEAQCQSDGWSAFGHKSLTEFERICGFYGEVGLADEAASLWAQMAAFRRNPDDHSGMEEVASSKSHELSGDLDRVEYLTQYFCDHAEELLYERA
jgi:hypothetical protein